MRIRITCLTLLAIVLGLGASSAFALDLDLNIENVVVGPSPASATLADLVIAPSGDSATTALLATGNVVSLTITVANPAGELIDGIFVSVVTDGPQVDFLGANPVAPSILAGGTFFNPLALNNIGTGAVKGNSPSLLDPAAPLWVQGLAYGSGLGSDGTGPDNAVTLFYSITGASGSDTVLFDLALTAGDGIGGASTTTFSSAIINAPEPGAAALALASLGAIALVTRGRRRA